MTQSKIYVGNLSYSVTQEDLHQFFSQFGDIEEAIVINDRLTGRSKGFGFVHFHSPEAAQAALAMDNQPFEGRNLKVNLAKEESRESRSRSANGNRNYRR